MVVRVREKAGLEEDRRKTAQRKTGFDAGVETLTQFRVCVILCGFFWLCENQSIEVKTVKCEGAGRDKREDHERRQRKKRKMGQEVTERIITRQERKERRRRKM
jgi:hypothetical protein